MKAIISKAARRKWAWVLALVMIVSIVIPTSLLTAKADVGTVKFIDGAAGWLESAYAQWAIDNQAEGYTAYIKKASQSDSAYARIDNELIRKYKNYYRVDAVGLAAGDYVIKVVPVKNGKEVTDKAQVTKTLNVSSYDRSGFAFSSESKYKTGSGAYNENGTLKKDAIVLYVTNDNAKTIKASVKEAKGEKEYTGLQTIIDAYTKSASKGIETRALDVRVIGCVTDTAMDKFSSSSEGVQIKGASAYSNLNMTIEGIGDDATINGFGFLLRNAGNVEMRNFSIINFMDDGISLDTANCNVWIHNVDLYYGKAGGDADQAKGDGSIDIKGNSQYITVSYVHFYDSGKCSLCGMKSESGPNYITYHHNWFDHSDSRHPRIRTMSVHVYNNYYDGNSKYGVGAAKDSEAFVEANYFRNCNYPMLSSMQGSDVLAGGIFSGENGGVIKAYNNYMEGQKSVIYANSDAGTTTASATDFDAYLATSRSETVPSTYKAKQGGKTYSNFDTKVDLGVDTADIDAPADVPSIVTKYAGRIMGGDFKWTFDNSVDDTSYSLNKPLKDKLNAYKTTLVSVGGGSVSGESHTHTYGEWTVVKAATETEEGLKSRTCTGCGYNETAVIPAIGKDTPVTPDTPVSGDAKVHNFTESGTTSDFYSITGSIATNKGTATYNGLTLTKCLKMESSTSIKFTAPSAGKLTLVFGGTTAASGKGVKVNGTSKKVGSDGTLTVDVAKGAVTVTKGDSINLFYMVYTPSGTSETTHTHKYESKITKQATCTEAGVLTYTCTSTTGTCDKKTYTETIPAKGHSFSTEWTVDVEATETTPGSKSHHCTVCDAKTDVTEIPATGVVEKKNGLSKAEDGNYYYYADDVVDTSFTGFADCDNERMYVKNGKVDTTYTSVEQDGADWVYVENGKIRYDYTGIRQNSNGWWRIKDGKVDFSYTGLADNENGRFYIENGKVNFKYTNLIQDGADWVYVKNGHVQSNYTGFATNENGRFYLENGKVNFGYTNVIQDGSDWVYVKGGYIRYDYTGIRQNANGWWRIENGKVNFKYNGVASNENGMFYLENGLVKFNYTGTYIQDGIKYNIVNGVVKGKENVLTVMRMPYSVLTNSIKMVI